MTSFLLHILAMGCMLLDHMWATVLPLEWMTCVGRIAFPIFAFTTAEGYYHTHDLKKYMKRLLIFALISEIPFNYMCGGQFFYPYHQNVMWTFLLALGGMYCMDRIRRGEKRWKRILLCSLVVLGSFVLGYMTMVDYYGAGILMVYVFYFFRGKSLPCLALQLAGMYFLNVTLLGGYYYDIKLFGFEIELMQQAIALLSLIPIWLYNGRQGHHSPAFRYFCYAFYPLHITVLVLTGFFTGR